MVSNIINGLFQGVDLVFRRFTFDGSEMGNGCFFLIFFNRPIGESNNWEVFKNCVHTSIDCRTRSHEITAITPQINTIPANVGALANGNGRPKQSMLAAGWGFLRPSFGEFAFAHFEKFERPITILSGFIVDIETNQVQSFADFPARDSGIVLIGAK